jgi:hypothetical protein
MCMFTQPIEEVRDTRIFARSLPEGRQVLVYQMGLHTKRDVAMILPIPAKPGSGGDAVQFVDLSGCPQLMVQLERLFPGRADFLAESAADPFAGAETIEVKTVGSYEASYVLSLADFARLDERFRLPPGAWEKLPGYSAFGFVVFKFKEMDDPVHPMAFAFPRANPAQLFFPTVHVHDGEVHAEEEFDHQLFCQKLPGDTFSMMEWEESKALPATSVQVIPAKGIVDPRLHVLRRVMKGKLKNADVVLG